MVVMTTILILPWAFGGVHTRTQSLASWVLALCLLTIAATRSANVESGITVGTRVSWLTIILFAGILLGCCQLIPLSSELQAVFAKGATKWRELQLGKNFSDQLGSIQSTRTLYAPASRKCLALLIAATATCWMAETLLRILSPKADARRSAVPPAILFLGLVTLNGFALSLFGIVQKLRWNRKLFWVFELSQGGSPFGPFVNRNNAGGFLLLCLAAAIGLLVWQLETADAQGSNGSNRQVRKGAIGFGIAMLIAGILATGSRGASLSLCIAAVATLATWAWTNRRSHITAAVHQSTTSTPHAKRFGTFVLLAAVVACAGGLGSWLGTMEETERRWELTLEEDIADGRLLNWQESLATMHEFWGLGTGLQAYRFASLPHQNRSNENWYYFAENQFVQAFVDAGIVGLGLLCLAIGVVVYASYRLLYSEDPVHQGVGAMGIFLIVSQALSGSFDFGLYIGSNTLLMAASCGVIVGTHLTAKRSSQPDGRRFQAVFAIGLSLAIATGVSGLELWRAADVEDWSNAANLRRLTENDEADSAEDEAARLQAEEEQLARLNKALSRRWDDAEGHLAAGFYWMRKYRQNVHRQIVQEQPWLRRDQTWAQSSMGSELRMLAGMDQQKLRVYRQFTTSVPALKKAEFHFRHAGEMCPWLATAHVWQGYSAFLLGDDAAAESASRAASYAGGRGDTWYWTGVLHVLADNQDQARNAWRNCLAYTNQFDDAINDWTQEFQIAGSVDDFLPNQPAALLRWANYRQKAEQRAASHRLAQRGLEVLPQTDDSLDWIEVVMRAKFYQLLGDEQRSAAAWSRGIELGGDAARMDYATALMSDGQEAEAMAQLRQCKSQVAKNLLSKLKQKKID